MTRLTYEQAGVDYGTLDSFKRACQRHAAQTAGELAKSGYREVPGVRGESAYLVEMADAFLAHVEEGLGTKNLVADAMRQLTGEDYYQAIGIDTVATIVNDLVTLGAMPISVAMHAAVGDSSWFSDAERAEALAEGFAQGCRRAGAVWGGGETPALKGLVCPGTIVLAGSAIGQIRPKSNRIVGELQDGDAIVLLGSSGVHTNGLTLCRAVAERLPDGYLSRLSDGRPYGQALLDPSVIYVDFVRECQRQGVMLRYTSHITGHGWRKLMRLEEPFVYVIDDPRVQCQPPIFEFIHQSAALDLTEAYATFNMGAGFAAYVRPADADRCVTAAEQSGYSAWRAGRVIKQGPRKAVEIPSLNIVFEGETLRVR